MKGFSKLKTLKTLRNRKFHLNNINVDILFLCVSSKQIKNSRMLFMIWLNDNIPKRSIFFKNFFEKNPIKSPNSNWTNSKKKIYPQLLESPLFLSRLDMPPKSLRTFPQSWVFPPLQKYSLHYRRSGFLGRLHLGLN